MPCINDYRGFYIDDNGSGSSNYFNYYYDLVQLELDARKCANHMSLIDIIVTHTTKPYHPAVPSVGEICCSAITESSGRPYGNSGLILKNNGKALKATFSGDVWSDRNHKNPLKRELCEDTLNHGCYCEFSSNPNDLFLFQETDYNEIWVECAECTPIAIFKTEGAYIEDLVESYPDLPIFNVSSFQFKKNRSGLTISDLFFDFQGLNRYEEKYLDYDLENKI